MKKCFRILAAIGLAFAALPAFAAGDEVWLCKFKGYTEDGQHYYIVVKPFDGDPKQYQQLNSQEFGKALYAELAPGKRYSSEIACAMRGRELSEKWWKDVLAGEDYFSGPANSTLSEWRDGKIVALPWPKAKK
jgi:hypothetical protein